MKKFSLCLLITLLLIPCWGCSANKSVDTYDTYTYMTTEKMITMSEAIQLAQDDDFVEYSIANLYFFIISSIQDVYSKYSKKDLVPNASKRDRVANVVELCRTIFLAKCKKRQYNDFAINIVFNSNGKVNSKFFIEKIFIKDVFI